VESGFCGAAIEARNRKIAPNKVGSIKLSSCKSGVG
jgi:hypothetical protein